MGLCNRGKGVSLAVIREADGFGSAPTQLPDRHRLSHIRPASVTVRRLAAYEKKGAWSAHGEHREIADDLTTYGLNSVGVGRKRGVTGTRIWQHRKRCGRTTIKSRLESESATRLCVIPGGRGSVRAG
jgi:hypothetical protein